MKNTGNKKADKLQKDTKIGIDTNHDDPYYNKELVLLINELLYGLLCSMYKNMSLERILGKNVPGQ
jgi:hypothetical protein